MNKDVVYVAIKEDDNKFANVIGVCTSKEVAIRRCREDFRKEYGKDYDTFGKDEYISKGITRIKIYIGEYVNIYYIVKKEIDREV